MGKTINIRRGFDIKLKGAADKTISELPTSDVVAVKPPDFTGVVPKLLVNPGDDVVAGQPLFFDKNRPNLRFPSPVSGEVAEVVRGAKRRILEVRILADRKDIRYKEFPKADPASLDRAKVIEQLVDSGCWQYIRQRPYSIIADPVDMPKAVFVSCFDSAPMAPDMGYVVNLDKENFQAGLQALNVLANGQLHVGVRDGADGQVSDSDIAVVPADRIHHFRGPHPAGNVGVQIHHVNPIKKDEMVWTVNIQDVIIIGRLFREGRFRADRVFALTGSCVNEPQYFQAVTGQRMSTVLNGRLNSDHCRVIQGNVLTGKKSSSDDFLSFYTNQITVIPEGDQPEFFGWLLPGFKKLSLSRTFFSWLAPNRVYDLDTNMHGEERAFVISGQYDRVLPMNIYPVYLLKAILARDIERMEQLGIYEVAEEDFALCEFVCTSKINVQEIVAEGLAYMQTEG
ncbi:MAG: Na(+)-translocating NADH-quinone reductase subunit A [Bacteroidetes bacterium]|nr:MAG: Na(+)-translocating NADH-quinone reductase subunit A [Bacteroidota bacterium]